MITDPVLLLTLKIVVVAGFVSLMTWVAVYTHLAAWWRNPIGQTLVAKTVLIAALLVPSALSLFLGLNRQTSEITGWVDAVLLGLVTPVMLWRTVVFWRFHKSEQGGAAGANHEPHS